MPHTISTLKRVRRALFALALVVAVAATAQPYSPIVWLAGLAVGLVLVVIGDRLDVVIWGLEVRG